MPKKDKTGAGYDPKRRKFLQILGLGTAVLVGESAASQIRIKKAENRPLLIAKTGQRTNYISVNLLRPEDLLSLELRYYNFNLLGNLLQKKGSPAFLVVIFQPQSISEQAWNEGDTPTVPGKLMIGAESRLVFSIPENITSIPLDLNDLLAWEKYNLVVNNRAKQPGTLQKLRNPVLTPTVQTLRNKISEAGLNTKVQSVKGLTKDERLTINSMLFPEENSRREVITNMPANMMNLAMDPVGPPAELETSIEVPLRLYLSPTKNAGWNHLRKIKKDKGVLKETNRLFELWHTRMGTKTANGIDESELTNEQRILRALWADDANKDYKADVIKNIKDKLLDITSMTNKDRHQIVHESSNFQIPNFVPQPIKAYKLFLTTLGAWLDSELVVERKKLEAAGVLKGNVEGIEQHIEPKNALNLLKWRHIETLGREHYVEIVNAGNILPFGHEAVLIKITERKPDQKTGTAANFQRELIVITEPVKEYNYIDNKGDFMNFCFNRIEMVTTISPILKPDKTKLADSLSDGQFIIISKEGEKVIFNIKAEDIDGNMVDFSMPLVFVNTEVLGSSVNINSLISAYRNGGKVTNAADLRGQKLSLARKETNSADTAYVSYNIKFGAKPYINSDEPQGFLPELTEVEIIEPSYQRLTGGVKKVPVSLVDDRNAGHVFAEFKFREPVNFSGQTDKTGGIAAPNFNLTGLSKAAGAFGGELKKFKNAEASADDYFKVAGELPEPKLFGVFKLSDILDFGSGDKSAYDLSKPLLKRAPKIPNLVTEETATKLITTYLIKPQLKKHNIFNVVGFEPVPGTSEFEIKTQVIAKKKDPTSPGFSAESSIKNFRIEVIKFSAKPKDCLIYLDFKEIRFAVDAATKSDVSVSMGNEPIRFGGPLSFINEINKLVPPDGFSDPPYLDVSLTGIKCGYTLSLPDLQLGAFSLSHMSLGAEVNLPFTGGPMTFGFRFCERHQPFTLAVSFLGGGGFFGMELDLYGIRQIEAALEFGACVSMNFGVASGSVSVMGGIYFKMMFEVDHNSTQLTGYVRINGAVSVLGLITASLELYMALTYLSNPGKAYGEASMKINVELLFFSISVTIKTQKTFAGSGSDPNFQMCISEGEWQEYCGAFVA